jgi:hypothetical protein
MAKQRVVIEHKDGRSYSVLPADFKRLADSQYKGFKIVSNEDGSPYQEPKPRAPKSDKDGEAS